MTATGPAREERPRDAVDADVAADRGDGPRLAVAPDTRAERVKAARVEWNRRLVELGGPNTLLWYQDHPTGTLDLGRAHLGARGHLLGGAATRLSDLIRESSALDDARRRAAAVARTSREVLEGHGTRTCFLGIGMATWTVRRPSDGARAVTAAAPVLLRAVEVRPVDAVGHDWVLDPGPELELNPVLAQYMASAHGIELDSATLEELALAGSTVDGYPTYAALADACANVPDLSVSPRVVVGTFPYFKARLVADLAAPVPALTGHDVVAALAGDSLASPRARTGADPDARELLVLDTDASQRAVVGDARSGSHVVVRGAPGTGKTQAVANLVATLAADGQRVLLVAPGRAAVESVTSRLAAVGLDDLVLDVVGGGHERRRVVRELVEGMERLAAGPVDDPGGAGRAGLRRAEAAADLDEHRAALHDLRAPWGVSLHEVQEAIGAFAATQSPPRSRVRLDGDVLRHLDPVSLAATVRSLTRLAELSRWDGDGIDDPWFAARLENAADVAEARERVERLAGGGVDEAATTFAEVFRGIQLPRHPTVLDWGRVLRTVGEVRDTLEVFSPEVFDIPLGDLVAATASSAERRASGAELTGMDRLRLRRQARGLLRPGRPPESLHDALASAHEQRDAWRELAGSGGRPEIPVELDRAHEAHTTLTDDLRWLDARLAGPEEGGSAERLLELDLERLGERVAALAAASPHLDDVPEQRAALDALGEAGLRPLADDLRARAVPAADVGGEVEWVWWCSIAEHVGRADTRVAGHDGRALTEKVDELARAEAAVLEATPARVRAAVARRFAEIRRRFAQQEVRLRTEAGRVRPMPLPELVASTSDLLTAIRPCWAVSALDVPSVLPPGELFDVVVLEDASALAVAEAVPAVLRARRVVVVGDTAQTPPSSFVAAPGERADDEPVPPSVLDVLGPALPERRLGWDHRSRDGRLVSFVSDHVYGGALVTVPDVDRSPVTRLEVVEGHGVVTAGDAAVESTTAEVDRVVELVLEHARLNPARSLAVVALNRVHADRIEEALRTAVASADAATSRFFGPGTPEPFVVRPFELAQGLERDVVVVAVGYGKTPHGRVLHRFGLLGTELGDRHLTVALTRARRSMTVVSTLAATELDPGRLKARGPQLLRALLEDLGPDRRERPASNGERAASGSVLVADLARRLRDHGLGVHEGVGVGPEPVDLAVEDPARPGTLLLAVESDGPRYAAVEDARDRDRLRAEELRRRGWQHLRVWSTDLFRDPARDVSRILDAVGVREAPGD